MLQFKAFYIFILFALVSNNSYSRFVRSYRNIRPKKIENIVVRYDPTVLRIPGNSFRIGITTILQNGAIANTRGYLDGKTSWRNFKIEVEGGCFLFGKIWIHKTDEYTKDKFLICKSLFQKNQNLA